MAETEKNGDPWQSTFLFDDGTHNNSSIKFMDIHGLCDFYGLLHMQEKNQKTGIGTVTYEVILKPAVGHLPGPPSPPNENGLVYDNIICKLPEAKERRQSLEAKKLANISKSKKCVQEVLAKAQFEKDDFRLLTKVRLQWAMKFANVDRETYTEEMQWRLSEHLLKVEKTCRMSDGMTKELDEKIKSKLKWNEENRNAQIQAMAQRLKEYVSCPCSPDHSHSIVLQTT